MWKYFQRWIQVNKHFLRVGTSLVTTKPLLNFVSKFIFNLTSLRKYDYTLDIPGHWFPNLTVHQHHLESLLNTSCRTPPPVSESVDLGWDRAWKFALQTSSKWRWGCWMGPHFKNQWSRSLIISLGCTVDSLEELKKNTDAWILSPDIWTPGFLKGPQVIIVGSKVWELLDHSDFSTKVSHASVVWGRKGRETWSTQSPKYPGWWSWCHLEFMIFVPAARKKIACWFFNDSTQKDSEVFCVTVNWSETVMCPSCKVTGNLKKHMVFGISKFLCLSDTSLIQCNLLWVLS